MTFYFYRILRTLIVRAFLSLKGSLTKGSMIYVRLHQQDWMVYFIE